MKQLQETSKTNAILVMLGVPLLVLTLVVFAILFSLEAVQAAELPNSSSTNFNLESTSTQPHFSSTTYLTQTAKLTVASDTFFGHSVKISGDGNTALANGGLTTGGPAVYFYTRSGTNWNQVAQFSVYPNRSEDTFGSAMDLSSDGSSAIIGDNGVAFIYSKNAGTWSQSAVITATATPGTTNYGFGESVSMSSDGNTVLVGAYEGQTAFIFTKSNGVWSQVTELTVGFTYRYNLVVSLSGDGKTAVIGSDSNGVTIFNNVNGIWTQTQFIAPPSTGDLHFAEGIALSTDGSTLIVNAYEGNYIYTHSNGTWSLAQEFVYSTNYTTGYALTSDGNTLFIASNDGTYNKVTLYARNGTVWSPSQVVTLSNTGSQTLIGTEISTSADGSHTILNALVRQYGSAEPKTAYIVSPGSTTSLSSSANPSVYGQSITFNTTVSPTIATGSVIFTDTTTNTKLGSVTVNNGTASVSTSNLAVGSHQIVASYSGNDNYGPSTSITLTQTVNKGNSAVKLVAAPNPVGLNSSVSIVATVSPVAPASGVPTGSVIITDTTTNTKLSTVALDTSGVASIVTSTLSVGNHVLAASFSGDTNFNASSASPVTLTVSPNSSYYLPFIANNANGFTTYLAFQNVGTQTANVSIIYYDKNGNSLPSSSLTTQVAKYGEVLPPNPFASGTYGAGVITSDQPLNIIVPEATPYGGSAYVVPSGSSNSLIAPFALNNAYGDFTTQLNIFNWGSNAVTAKLTFYGTVGSSSTVVSNSTTIYIPAHLSTNISQSSLPDGFNGWAQISGDANTLVAQVLEQSPSTKFVAIANAVAVPSDIQYTPAIFNAGYGSFYTGANIVNPNSNPVNVTVTYYDQTGNAIPSSPFTIAGYSEASIFNGASSGNGIPSGGLPQGFVGAAKVNAVGGGVVVSVNENGGTTPTGNSRSGTYAALSNGGSVVGLPVVSNGGYSYITGDTIFNTSNQSVTASINYYNLDGSEVAGSSKTFTVAGGASAGFYHGDGSLPSGFYGTAVISETSGPANALIVTTNAQNSVLFYTYSEPNS